MYGREELIQYKTHINCSFFKSYLAEEADKVMDAMERRISRLTALVEGWKKNSVVLGEMYHKRLEDVQNTMATENVDLGMENFKLKERVKELEMQNDVLNAEYDFLKSASEEKIKELETQCIKYQAELMNNNPALNPTISKMETTTPKWISVKDRLPEEEKPYILYVKGHQGVGDEQMIVYWDASRRDFCVGEEGWPIDDEYSEVTHWMQLPPPPTTEESSVVKKEK